MAKLGELADRTTAISRLFQVRIRHEDSGVPDYERDVITHIMSSNTTSMPGVLDQTEQAAAVPGYSARFLAVLAMVGNRVAQGLLAALGASVLVWALLPLAPGDPAQRTLEARGIRDPTPEQIEAIRKEFRLDDPLPLQYLHWLSRAVRGDFSISYQSKKPVLYEMQTRLPATIRLAVTALVIALLLAVPTGLVAAAYHQRLPDSVLRGLALVTSATPSFLLGLVILQFIILKLGLGRVVSDGSFRSALLPATCLALGVFATWSRLLRSTLISAVGARYTIVAQARGAEKSRILLYHAFPNALPPLLHAIGVGIGALISGAPIVEAVFTWPGLGTYVVSGVAARDLPVVQGFACFATLAYVASSLIMDTLSGLIDPVSLSRKKQ